jgi:hypothetical protein
MVLGLLGSSIAVGRAGEGAIADMSLSINDSPDPVSPFHIVRYRIRVTNNGPDPADGISVDGNLDVAGSIEDAEGNNWFCFNSDSDFTCFFGTAPTRGSGAQGTFGPSVLNPGQSAPPIDVFVNAGPYLEVPLVLSANVDADQFDPNEGNDAEEETTQYLLNANTASGFIGPEGGTLTTCPGGGPTSPDDTCATLTVPPGGPGGAFKLVEERRGLTLCGTVFQCLGADVNAIVPGGYTAMNPLTLELFYDQSELPSGRAGALTQKLPGVTQPLLRCLLPPNRILPCLESSGRTGDRDVRLVILFVSDPKFQGFATLR